MRVSFSTVFRLQYWIGTYVHFVTFNGRCTLDMVLPEHVKLQESQLWNEADPRPTIRITACLFVLVAMICLFLYKARAGPGWVLFICCCVLSTFWLTVIARLFRRWVRWHNLHRTIRANGFRVCVHCKYSLLGHPDEGMCPECGMEYRLEDLKKIWTAAGHSGDRRPEAG